MAKYNCPEKFITIIRQFHDGMHARIKDNGESSVAFLVINGVKQGCFLAPILFSIMFSVMLFDAFRGCPRGVMVKLIGCRIVVSEFELQTRYYVHFRANTLGKGMNPLILPAMG